MWWDGCLFEGGACLSIYSKWIWIFLSSTGSVTPSNLRFVDDLVWSSSGYAVKLEQSRAYFSDITLATVEFGAPLQPMTGTIYTVIHVCVGKSEHF